MAILALNREFSFAIEAGQKRARVIVYKHSVENVCRKENVGKLRQFLKSGKGRLFKDRLQFHKNALGICVMIKGQLAGIFNNGELIRMIR